jgi:hypothetical protein
VASADTAALRRAQEAAIPTLESVDAKRPSRARAEESLQAIPEGSLVGESTRLVPFDGSPRIKGICRASLRSMKSALARLGIRGFKQKLRKAPEDTPILQNTRAEISRDMARLAMLREQIKAIEQARQQRLDQAPDRGPHAMVLLLARIIGVGVDPSALLRTRTCRSREVLVLKPARRTLRRLSAHQGPLTRFAQERRCPDLSYGCDAAGRMGSPLGASPLKRLAASWSGSLAWIQPKARLRRDLSRPMAGSPRFDLGPLMHRAPVWPAAVAA